MENSMTVISRVRSGITILALLILCGCTQTITTSSIRTSLQFASSEMRKSLVEKVYGKTSQLGGHCSLINKERDFHRCALPFENPLIEISVGISAKGVYLISVESTFSTWLPVNKERLFSGEYLPDVQKELENWMISLVPSVNILSAERYFPGFDYSQPLLLILPEGLSP